ncbi:MAG: hypothetical protein ACTSYU_10535, partial [Promethearchaeota archaeon]
MKTQKFKLKILAIFLFGMLSVCAFYSNENQISQDENEKNISIDLLNYPDPPLTSDVRLSEQNFPLIDNQSFDFSSQESVTRTFSQQIPIEGNSTFNVTAPSNYTLANISVSLDGLADGYENITIAENAGFASNEEMQAQSFSITRKVWITSLSLLFNIDKKAITPNITIRRENETGDILLLHNTAIPITGGWINVVSEPLILDPGLYFVRMDVLPEEVASSNLRWQKTAYNSTLTMYYDTSLSSWESANFDIGLSIITTGYIEDKSAVDVFVNDQKCIYEGDFWMLDLTETVENDKILLNFTTNIFLIYTYGISCTYFRFTPLIPHTEVDTLTNKIILNFTLDLIEPSIDYENYQVIMNNISDYDVDVTWNGTTVNFEVRPGKIVFFELADRLVIVSSNAINQFDVILSNHVGDITNINITTGYSGNITWFIYENDELIHSQINYTDGFLSLDWEIIPSISSQILFFRILFIGEGHVGWGEEEINLLQHTNIDASPIAAYVFDEIVLECDYREFFSNNMIDNATITYELEGFSSPLIQEELNPNVYQATLDLGRYNFEPGTYELTYTASRNGYDPQIIHTELTIAPRTVNFEIVQNSKNLKPGDELRFTINLEDILGGNQLLCPVDVKISLFSETPQPAKFQNNGYTIYSETANNID